MNHLSAELPRLAIVVPCYNEALGLPQTLNQLLVCLADLSEKNKISNDSFIYCVDDGSDDTTWEIITKHHRQSNMIKGLKLAKNVGHQNAILAGLLNVKNKVACAITIDADLQDDVTAIAAMIDRFHQGYDIVCGVRKSRRKDSFFKHVTAILFYKIMKKSGADIVFNHADFRLLSQRVLVTLSRFKERNLFLRGIFPLMGYRVAKVDYDRNERVVGESKYPFRKMLALAWDGMTSFSHIPLQFIMSMGLISFFLSLAMTAWVIVAKIFSDVVPGWASIMIPLCFMGGVQLLSIGIIGQYVAKVYLEVKRRPRFIKDVELL